MNDKWVGIWKEAVMVYLKVLLWPPTCFVVFIDQLSGCLVFKEGPVQCS
jgi:hypothetical protein